MITFAYITKSFEIHSSIHWDSSRQHISFQAADVLSLNQFREPQNRKTRLVLMSIVSKLIIHVQSWKQNFQSCSETLEEYQLNFVWVAQCCNHVCTGKELFRVKIYLMKLFTYFFQTCMGNLWSQQWQKCKLLVD